MNVIGLDFGTTNSILSYVDGDRVESFKLGGSDGTNYIPSFLTIDDGHIDIGIQAKENAVDDNSIDIYARFKMMLAEKDKNKLDFHGYGDGKKTPKEVSKEYINKLVNIYKEEQKLKDGIKSLVVTIPEIWQNDNMSARTELKSAIDELGLPLKKLESEPIGAGAYFLYKYKKNQNKDFNGHFLIFDYGGGTLDISLLHSENQKIKILERTGKGHSENHLGNAGVAYDNHVVKTAFKKATGEDLTSDDPAYYALLIEFESKKIRQKDKIERSIEKYKKRKNDSPIFKVSEEGYTLEFTPSLLIECFEEISKPDIVESLKEIKKYFDFYNIDEEGNDGTFKVVLVGGFSSYCLSQNTVMEFLGTETLSDKRFEQDLTKEETSLAISKGAALISAGSIGVKETYPLSIGLVINKINPADGYLKEIHETVFKKGDTSKINEIKMAPQIFKSTGKPTLFFDNGTHSFKVKLDHDIDKLFPNYEDKSNSWQIGFEMDENQFFYIYVFDDKGDQTKQELGNLIEDYKDTLIAED